MNRVLWRASTQLKKKSNLFKYENYLKNKYNYSPNGTYSNLLKWSIKNSEDFWSSIWDYANVKGKKNINTILSKKLYKSKFLNKSKLNFAENILRKQDKDKAITFVSENGYREIKTWIELYRSVSKIVKFFQDNQIKTNDRVVGYMPNIIETVECFLASSTIGAIWSSCSPDFGVNGVVERFSQIKPKILIICDRYYYNGKEINVINRLPKILSKIKSIKKVIIVNYPGKEFLNCKKFRNIKIFKWNEIKKLNSSTIYFKKFDFNKELVILFSSGTTGKPKCICHRAGGVLLQHLKEHILQCEIKPKDNVFYFTTCGWMMWNWLVSVLGSKASIVLFDGYPMYKRKDLLFKIASRENISMFGVSAKYIDNLNNLRINIKSKYRLKKLKTICSTGSPLSGDSFEYVYKKIKSKVHLASISGGTDIVSCFVLGNIYDSVVKGQIQNSGLGMDVDVFNDKGKSIKNRKGELVCKNAFPSMPIKFWNDSKFKKYKSSYFLKFPGVWHHGDFAEKTDNNSFIIYGRSDATLNPGGVRIGTSEIYSVVEKFKFVNESLAVGQNRQNDIRIILFVVMKKKIKLSEKIKKEIRIKIRKLASPRHVPSKIIQVSDIPRTKNGKIVELAVKNIIEGNKLKNIQAIANPNILEEFKNIAELN